MVKVENKINKWVLTGALMLALIATTAYMIPTPVHGQVIKNIEQKNADCRQPILITDTLLVSMQSPHGYGNEKEIADNAADDKLYFENEHNTVWYKFWAKESCDLTFDIIPFDKNDDYDFMLYRYNGGDFRSKMITKKLKPIRTCISRNDKSIDSKTGLSLNVPDEQFVHSGIGASYVKFIPVIKGEAYYLLVDNVYDGGRGHSIQFHYRCHGPDELYVGRTLTLDSIYFVSDEYKFRKGSEAGLESLYRFMLQNPKIKIEVQGHVNTAGRVAPSSKYGKQQLSDLRAGAIMQFLINKGVAAERITAVGYADRRKVIQNPKTKKEFFMNIKAGIMIIELDYTKKLSY
jgi:hypothetical protein